jgi:hypothetical protein
MPRRGQYSRAAESLLAPSERAPPRKLSLIVVPKVSGTTRRSSLAMGTPGAGWRAAELIAPGRAHPLNWMAAPRVPAAITVDLVRCR